MTLTRDILLEMTLSAAALLENEREEINALNIFPVPDGDTGANMSMTMAGARGYIPAAGDNLGDLAAAIAGKLLRSARGNSGVILSLFFKGFGKALAHLEEADTTDLAAAFRAGSDCAYRSVMNPTEGTILTVMRCTAEEAEGCAADFVGNPADFFARLLTAAERALNSTPDLLPVLKSAGVVDAGGRGFLAVLRGMLAALRGNPVRAAGNEPKAGADFAAFETGDIRFAYCTECIVEKDEAHRGEGNAAAMGEFAVAVGDSVVFVDDEEIFKLHVHTSDPGKLLSKALEFGTLYTVKVENMRNQHTALAEKEPVPMKNEPPKPYGFVCVSAGEGISTVFRDLGADAVVHGGQTMNPSMEDILRHIDKVNAEVIYVLPNNGNIYMAAQQAAKMVKEKSVYVLPTRTIPQGMSAMLNFDESKGPDTNYKGMKAAAAAVRSYSVTYAERDSLFDGKEIGKDQILGLAEGKVRFVTDSRLDCLAAIAADLPEDAAFLTVFTGEGISPEEAADAEALFRAARPAADLSFLPGGQPIYSYLISAE